VGRLGRRRCRKEHAEFLQRALPEVLVTYDLLIATLPQFKCAEAERALHLSND